MKPHLQRLTLPFLTAAIIAATLLPARAADGPTPYPDAKEASAWPGHGVIRVHGWMTDNRKHFWTQRQKDKGAVVFVGDSLTGGWKSLAASFPGLKVANRGIGGDVSRGVVFRFKEDVLDLEPEAIVINIGSNDLSAHGDPATIEANIQEMIRQARAYKSNVPIIVCTIPPRDKADAPAKPGAYADINTRILKLGKPGKDFEVLDLYTLYANKEGKPANPEHFAADKLHLAEPGYQVWAEALKPVFARMDIK
jgi:lysophospholipase L1-like esterase